MRIIISGGGTGGHIYPALAIADGLKNRYKDIEILYVGTKGSLEEELSTNAGYEFQSIHVKGMPRRFNKKSTVAVAELFRGLHDSRKILDKFKPDLVVGTGGYVCGPILYRAARSKIPTVIHEQNAFPGITNKILSRFVDKVLITYEESRKYFTKCRDVSLTGNPIRQDILLTDKQEARKELGFDEKPLVLSFGGSGGQRSLNDSMLGVLKKIILENRINLIHVTGKSHYNSFFEKIEEEKIQIGDNVEIISYHHSMPLAISAADIVITSGGAIALAEISAAGKPSILIPKAYTAENHQEFNARAFEDNGAAKLILEKELNPEILFESIMKLVFDDEKLNAMSKKSRELGNPGATILIIEEIDKLI
ncbi:undecaprenyldiphospho-muramoylpentapeptide beta-N-acetylglucosaminyltransferase [Gudongella sp. DL1XJH-153]|uniref:undecaprenyldiphospho-muramoylpentapeptide beta-N-acetylglucosaminyltransferase n=1 Tax=Gudongella sp. DL1XJH-153 TaxID=3409804 RepID=UPI003BB7F9D6